MLQVGSCVNYQEGGSGWVVIELVYYLKGKVVVVEVWICYFGVCFVVLGKNMVQYSCDQFNCYVLVYFCVLEKFLECDEQIGIVCLQVDDWEMLYVVKLVNVGWFYCGMFIDKKLEKGMEIEFEVDLLGVCEK